MNKLKEIYKIISAWKPEDIEGKVFAEFELFRTQCVDNGNCFDKNVLGAFAGISINTTNLLISSAAKHVSGDILDTYLPIYYKAFLLHYKLMQKYSFHTDKSDYYARMLDKFAFLFCLAIYLDEKEASFLCEEYIRHVDNGYQCRFSVDKSFMLFCYKLARWYVDGKFISIDGEAAGIYTELLKFTPEEAPSKISRVLDARVDLAYLQLVKNRNVEPTFYNTEFPALFPFEILAFLKLTNIELPSIEHPLISPFKDRKYELPENYKNMFDVCEREISTL